MSHTVTMDGETAVIRPDGDIVASAVEDLKAEIMSVLRQGNAPLALDLSGVEMIDSVGIGLLIATHNSLAKKSHKLELRGLSGDIQGLLRTMRLEKHFRINP